MNKTLKVTLLSLFVIPVIVLALLLYFTNDISPLPTKKTQDKAKKLVKQENAEAKPEIEWIALPAPSETKDKYKPQIPVDAKGRIKPHIIKSESEVRYLVNNLEKSPIYPKIIKSFYFYRNVPGQWDKKKAIGLIDARMKTLKPGESKLWFQLAGIDAYARRYVKGVPNASMSYAYIFRYSDKLAELDPKLFYRLISEMTLTVSEIKRARHPLPVNNQEAIILELLPVYLNIHKLSCGEPMLPRTLHWEKLKPLLSKMDKDNSNNFNYLYRSIFLPLPFKELDRRVPQTINHPDFTSQPAKIKQQFYLYLNRCYVFAGFDKQLKWLTKAVEAGSGYSKLLRFYYSYLSQVLYSTRRLVYLEKKFSNTSKPKKMPPYISKKEIKEIKNLYIINGKDNYNKLREKLLTENSRLSAKVQYLELLYLRDSKKERKEFLISYKPPYKELLAKALKDYSRPDDAINMFYFIRDKLKKEDKAYKYLEAFLNNIADPSKIKLRIVYILAKKFAKEDKTKALAVIHKVNLLKYDTNSGGALAFRVRLLSGLKNRLQKPKKLINKEKVQ